MERQIKGNATRQITGRVTTKKLIEFMNKKFKELEMDRYEVVEIVRTRFTPDQYASGATKQYIRVADKEFPEHTATMYCDYTMQELTEYLDWGYILYIRIRPNTGLANSWTISNLELDVKK